MTSAPSVVNCSAVEVKRIQNVWRTAVKPSACVCTHVGLAERHQLQGDVLGERRLHHRIQLIGDERLAVRTQCLIVHGHGNLRGWVGEQWMAI